MEVDAEGNPAGEVASPDKGKSSEGMSCDKDDSEPEGGHGSKNEDAKLSDAEDDNNNDDGAKGAEVQVDASPTDAEQPAEATAETSATAQKLEELQRECEYLKEGRTRAAVSGWNIFEGTAKILEDIKETDASFVDKYFSLEASESPWAEVLRLASDVSRAHQNLSCPS
eukprot:3941330-Rhodomonas_salina.1